MNMYLKSKKILLIIGGGISAYKSLDLLRLFKKQGAEIKVILTKSGKKFVTPLSVATLSNSKAYEDIFDVNNEDGSMIVATDYSQIGSVAWGDVFSLDTNTEIGSGDVNTQMIVDGNQNDNSADGFEFGSDDYAFKIVNDLEYNDNNDWFIPSRDSMKAIFDNVHSQGFGNFNESLIYWSSTKIEYSPYVMGFNFNSWGGEAFLGSCASPNGILIARKIN